MTIRARPTPATSPRTARTEVIRCRRNQAKPRHPGRREPSPTPPRRLSYPTPWEHTPTSASPTAPHPGARTDAAETRSASALGEPESTASSAQRQNPPQTHPPPAAPLPSRRRLPQRQRHPDHQTSYAHLSGDRLQMPASSGMPGRSVKPGSPGRSPIDSGYQSGRPRHQTDPRWFDSIETAPRARCPRAHTIAWITATLRLARLPLTTIRSSRRRADQTSGSSPARQSVGRCRFAS